MNKKEIECIKRLIEKDVYLDLKDYIIDNKLAKEEDFAPLIRDQERAIFICFTLEQALKDERLMLVDYEWTLLPLEFIKLTCVSPDEKKEFIHGL